MRITVTRELCALVRILGDDERLDSFVQANRVYGELLTFVSSLGSVGNQLSEDDSRMLRFILIGATTLFVLEPEADLFILAFGEDLNSYELHTVQSLKDLYPDWVPGESAIQYCPGDKVFSLQDLIGPYDRNRGHEA